MRIEMVGLPGSGKTTLVKFIRREMGDAELFVTREDLLSRSMDRWAMKKIKKKGVRALFIKVLNLSRKRGRYVDGAQVEKEVRLEVLSSILDARCGRHGIHAMLWEHMAMIKEIDKELYKQRLKVVCESMYLDTFIENGDKVCQDEGLLQKVIATLTFLKQHGCDVKSEELWGASLSNFFIFLDVEPESAYRRYLKRNERRLITEAKDQKEFFYIMRQEIIKQMDTMPESMKMTIKGDEVTRNYENVVSRMRKIILT